ncbi:hypothetical protein MJD09_26835, partial [bacterium]|nr:hypothetical protein [bacterium]
MEVLSLRIAPLVAVITMTTFGFAGEESDVTNATHRLTYVASEGTWISVDVSPDGQTLAFDLLGHIYTMPVSGGTASTLTEGMSWNMFPRYSPDGNKLLFTSDRSGSNDLWVMDLKTRSLQNVSEMPLPVHQGSWSEDGRHVFGTALNMKVRHPVYQFNFYGDKQELIPAGSRAPVSHLEMHPSNGLIYFEHGDARLYTSGARIKTYDTATGKTRIYIDRPGGACNPSLSPGGNRLAFVHRDDRTTVLVVHDLKSRKEKVVCRALDFDRQDSRSFYGAYPNMSWHPDGQRIFISYGGGIHAVDVATGDAKKIPFKAPVDREMQKTMRFNLEVPDDKAVTRSHRWGVRTPAGILFEAMGDLYLKSGGRPKNLTNSPDYETTPVFDSRSNTIYFASWNDDDLGAIYSMNLNGQGRTRL